MLKDEKQYINLQIWYKVFAPNWMGYSSSILWDCEEKFVAVDELEILVK